MRSNTVSTETIICTTSLSFESGKLWIDRQRVAAVDGRSAIPVRFLVGNAADADGSITGSEAAGKR